MKRYITEPFPQGFMKRIEEICDKEILLKPVYGKKGCWFVRPASKEDEVLLILNFPEVFK